MSELSLRVLADGDALVWEVTNTGSDPVRLWEQRNSWGWPMPRLHVQLEGGTRVLAPAPRIWTRNFPSAVEVGPQGSTSYALRSEDFDPEGLRAVADHADDPLRVQAELHCDPSPEAEEHRVWCGTVRGGVQELPPPHGWLRP